MPLAWLLDWTAWSFTLQSDRVLRTGGNPVVPAAADARARDGAPPQYYSLAGRSPIQ